METRRRKAGWLYHCSTDLLPSSYYKEADDVFLHTVPICHEVLRLDVFVITAPPCGPDGIPTRAFVHSNLMTNTVQQRAAR